MLSLVVVLVIAYLLGSLPFSLWAGRLLRGIDLRHVGSGNLGATNVLRTLGWRAAVPVLLLDIAKGAAAVWIARALYTGPIDRSIVALLAGVAAVAGHMSTPFASFHGGKGVATATGVFLSLAPVPTLLCALLFAVLTGITRYVSLGSIVAALALPVLLVLFLPHTAGRLPTILTASAVVIVIVWRHRENVRRLVQGTESRVGSGGKS